MILTILTLEKVSTISLDPRRYNTAVARATCTRYIISSKTRSLIDSKPVGNNLENLHYLPPKSVFFNDGSWEVFTFKNENKGIVYNICHVSVV